MPPLAQTPSGNVAHQVLAHGVAQKAVEFLGGGGFVDARIRGKTQRPIGSHAGDAVATFEKIAGRKFFDPLD